VSELKPAAKGVIEIHWLRRDGEWDAIAEDLGSYVRRSA